MLGIKFFLGSGKGVSDDSLRLGLCFCKFVSLGYGRNRPAVSAVSDCLPSHDIPSCNVGKRGVLRQCLNAEADIAVFVEIRIGIGFAFGIDIPLWRICRIEDVPRADCFLRYEIEFPACLATFCMGVEDDTFTF